MLFGHARRQPLTPAVPAMSAAAEARSTLTLTVDRPQHVPEYVVAAMLNEAAAIWNPVGVALRGDPSNNGETSTPFVHVIITDDPVVTVSADERLGWIRFLPSAGPEPIVHLSHLAALQLLDSTGTLRDKPARQRDILLARILGRALAHELGHYLLASKNHTPFGLMRPQWPLDELLASDRRGFGLPHPQTATTRMLCDSTELAAPSLTNPT